MGGGCKVLWGKELGGFGGECQNFDTGGVLSGGVCWVVLSGFLFKLTSQSVFCLESKREREREREKRGRKRTINPSIIRN